MKLQAPGVPLFLQFKRADCMLTRRAREISTYGLDLVPPFYRFPVTPKNRSDQHDLLLALDDDVNMVFYAAPRFHLISEIDSAYSGSSVAAKSIFISPSEIGELDDDSHHVSYDDWDTYLCSEPRKIRSLSAPDLAAKLKSRLDTDDRPVADVVQESLRIAVEAPGRAAIRRETRRRERGVSRLPSFEYLEAAKAIAERTQPDVVPTRRPRPLQEDVSALRRLADLAASEFHSQLVIVQRREDG